MASVIKQHLIWKYVYVVTKDYANEGLRTLCLAYRIISEEEYESWRFIFESASTTLNNRQQKLDDAAEMIETNLILLGATAIEDKLQEGVPESIHTLMESGIKIWVLTGDRQETAINIGYSCKLITPDMNLLVVNHDNHFDTKENLEKKLLNVKSSMGLGTPRLKMDTWTRFWRNKQLTDNGKFDKDYGQDSEVFFD